MNGINDSGINQFLQRRLNVTDSPAPASTLAPEVMPVILAKEPNIEDYYLRGERLCSTWGVATGGVGTYGVWRLHNPANSGTLVILEKYNWFLAAGASSLYSGLGAGGALAPSGSLVALGSVALDTRFRASSTNLQTVAIAQSDTLAVPAFTAGPIWTRSSDSVNLYKHAPIVLAPGYCVDWWTAGTNVTFVLSLFWRERAAQPSELG